MAFSPDPFTQTYTAIWTVLNAHTGFTNLVKVANQIRFDTGTVPLTKDSIQSGDVPQVGLLPAGGATEFKKDSSGFSIVKDFQLGFIAGFQQLQLSFFPLQWEIYRAFGIHIKANGRTLGLSFVSNVELADVTEDLGDFAETFGIQGWTGVLSISTMLYFSDDQITT